MQLLIIKCIFLLLKCNLINICKQTKSNAHPFLDRIVHRNGKQISFLEKKKHYTFWENFNRWSRWIEVVYLEIFVVGIFKKTIHKECSIYLPMFEHTRMNRRFLSPPMAQTHYSCKKKTVSLILPSNGDIL